MYPLCLLRKVKETRFRGPMLAVAAGDGGEKVECWQTQPLTPRRRLFGSISRLVS